MLSAMSAKRRLPVLNAPDESGPARPGWQWALFGGGLIVLAWVALTMLAAPISSVILRANVGSWSSQDELALRLAAASPEALGRISAENVALQTAVLAIASLIAGLVLGVWGPGRLLVEAACAGALVATGGVVFAMLSARADAGTIGLWGSVVLVPSAAAAAWAGAWLGARRKRPLPS
jgi:hypothetical protein